MIKVLVIFVVGGIFVGTMLGHCAHAGTLRVEYGVPTVTGIRPGAVSRRAYDHRAPIISERASAGVDVLAVPSPRNGCPMPAFEVVSGPASGRGCFGAQ